MAYYISFLKALSLRVNADTVHFFFNARKTPGDAAATSLLPVTFGGRVPPPDRGAQVLQP